MQYDQKQFTQNGLSMFSDALSKKESITVDKVIVDDLPTNNFSNLALLSLDSFADAMSFQANYTETSGNTLTVDTVMSNKGFTSSYTINELGLVGHIGDDVNNQSLMAVLVASDPFTLPAQQSNDTPSEFIPNITIQLANDDMEQVPVLVQDDAYVAQKDLDTLVGKNGYVKADEVDARITSLNNGKADKTQMYGKTDIDSMVNNLTDVKADKVNVYSKDDIDNKVDNVNSRIDNLNDGKADKVQMYGKTDIDSKVNNANARIDSLNTGKADKEDVNNQMTSLNNGKADKTAIYGKTDVDWRVNNANSRIDSLNDGKQDKQDSTNKFNYMNTIKANTDDMRNGDLQTYNSANSYTDQKYSDLDNKNDILSSRLEDYQKPNLAPFTKEDGNDYGQIMYIPVKAGKKYHFQMDVVSTGSWWVYFTTNWNSNDWNWIDSSAGGKTAGQHDDEAFTADKDGTMQVRLKASAGWIYSVKNICITETESPIPYSIAKQNKASIESENQLTTDYQAPNLVDDTDDWISLGKGNNSVNQGTVQLKANKSYWFSIDYNYDSSQQGDTTLSIWCLGKQSGQSVILSYNKNWGSKLSQSIQYTPNSDENITFYVQINGDTNNTGSFRHLTVTQSDDYVPYEVAQRNRLWNNRITNKTDNLSDRLDDLNDGKADKVQMYGKTDIDSKVNGLNDAKADKDNVYSKSDVDNKENYLNMIKANTNDMNDHIQGAFNSANNYTNYQVGGINNQINNLNSTKQDKSDSTNKFNYLNMVKANTNDMNQHIKWAVDEVNGNISNLNDDKADKYNTYSKNDVDSKINDLASNSWRELNVNGLTSYEGGHILCKIDWKNNIATLSGMITNGYAPSGQDDIAIIQPNNDFSFVNFNGNLGKFNDADYGWSSSTTNINSTNGNLSFRVGNGEYKVTFTTTNESGKSIQVPIQPK